MLDLRHALGIALFPLVSALGGCATNSDAAIDKAVQDRLYDQGVANQVQVSTDRRVVKLEGVVENTQERNQAEIAARQVRGVLAVDNRLVLKADVGVTGASLPASPLPSPTSSPLRSTP